ncbi:acyl-ACP desaturase [Williamsia sterculiae]|uniref:Acyl-[acyl-carrier-protein] desaturase n=1 Tax=Williamsia sterculiae TaxID=1344003 RepID=A0A1N7DSF3_9NOCA|nr:acyl-ACP desaturase [Williamsia sterculiae]SIR78813.1 acyl-[acyl-carrier-protein] desaturase [Williamsia sterculiae]
MTSSVNSESTGDTSTGDLSEEDLLAALDKALPGIADQHEAQATAWNPHDWVPWDEGRNFAFLGGEDFVPDEGTDDAELRAALLALLLTKDNLPSFHRVIALYFPTWNEWKSLVGVWTAEDNRHSIALRDYLVVRRIIDPEDAEHRRLVHVTAGYLQESNVKKTLGPVDVLALMAVHERQCVHFVDAMIGHADGPLTEILRRVRDDDALQATTFTRFLDVALNVDPDGTVRAVEGALAAAEPIGADIVDFDAERALISAYGDETVQARIAADLAAALAVESLTGLSDQGAAARDRLLARAAA